MRAFLMLLLTMVLAACGGSGGSKKDAPKDGNNIQDATDRRVCNRGTPATSIVGSWKIDQRSAEGPTASIQLTFDGRNLTWTTTCAHRGENVQASLTVPYNDLGNAIQVLQQGEDTRDFAVANELYQCTAGPVSAQSYPYTLKGACLDIGGTVFVPVR